MKPLNLMVTLWPNMPHFERFSQDTRLTGIRLNSACVTSPEIKTDLKLIKSLYSPVPLYFDIKGRQLRIEEVHENGGKYLDITLNHPIRLQLKPNEQILVYFKAGADACLLKHIVDHGKRLIFEGGPMYEVHTGDSLHILHESLQVLGPLFTNKEKEKIQLVRQFGFKKYFLSYVESQRDIDEFFELIGRDCELMLKIENMNGLRFVANEFQKKPNLKLVAARGDLYVEVDRPHHILNALKLIIEHDPEAQAASRMLLSIIRKKTHEEIMGQKDFEPHARLMKALRQIIESDPEACVTDDMLRTCLIDPVPSCADFSELAWLYDIGYRNMMLCDELCLQDKMLSRAVNAFDAFREDYCESDIIMVDNIPMNHPIIKAFFG